MCWAARLNFTQLDFSISFTFFLKLHFSFSLYILCQLCYQVNAVGASYCCPSCFRLAQQLLPQMEGSTSIMDPRANAATKQSGRGSKQIQLNSRIICKQRWLTVYSIHFVISGTGGKDQWCQSDQCDLASCRVTKWPPLFASLQAAAASCFKLCEMCENTNLTPLDQSPSLAVCAHWEYLIRLRWVSVYHCYI